MDGYYFLRVKKEYATAILEDLQILDAVELMDANDGNIPKWQQKEVMARLQHMKANPETIVDWETAIDRIKYLTK